MASCSSHRSSHTKKNHGSCSLLSTPSLPVPCIWGSFYGFNDQRPTPFYCGLNTHLHKNVVFQWVSWCALEAIPSWTAALTKSRGLRPCQVHAVREQVHRASLVESLSARWLPTPNHGNLGVFPAQISATFCRASFSLSWDCMGWEMSISTGVTSRDYSRDLQLSPGKDKKFLCCEFQMTSLIKNFPFQDM